MNFHAYSTTSHITIFVTFLHLPGSRTLGTITAFYENVIMGTSLLQLPLELKLKIYHYALNHSVVTLTAKITRIKASRFPDGSIDGWNYAMPCPCQKDVKAELVGQKQVISLLFVCREINAEVKHTIYDHLRLHVRWNIRPADPEEKGNLWGSDQNPYGLLSPLINGSASTDLLQKVSCISMPLDVDFWWFYTERSATMPNLKEVILYDKEQSAVEMVSDLASS